VGIWFLVGDIMVPAMPGDPNHGRFFSATGSQDGERALKPTRAGKPAMRQQPMIAKIDTERSEDIEPQHQKNDPGPTEEPGHECEARQEMDEKDWSRVS
jgi:hypothetical protein